MTMLAVTAKTTILIANSYIWNYVKIMQDFFGQVSAKYRFVKLLQI